MAIRNAEVSDLDAIADLAQDQRVRQQAWEPSFWPLAANAREVHPLFLRWTIGGGRSIAVVATSEDGLAGFAIATPLPELDGPCSWVLEDICVASPALWTSVGRALLAAVAAQAQRHGGERVTTPCAVADRARRAAFMAAGLDLNCWYRHCRLDAGTFPPVGIEEDDGEPGLPLPHLHGLSALASAASPIRSPGGQAMITPPIAAPPVFRPGGTTGLADPVVGVGPIAVAGLVDAVEAHCRARGDVALVVAVGPGEDPLDRELDRRGYSRPVEWWVLRPR